MTIEEILVQKHGPLMTVVALAESLDRSPEGLRMCLRGGSDWAKKINETKVQIGRRLYFRTAQIAKIFGNDESQVG